MAVKRESGNFGRSKSTGRKITRRITITSKPRGRSSSRSKSGGSGSSKKSESERIRQEANRNRSQFEGKGYSTVQINQLSRARATASVKKSSGSASNFKQLKTQIDRQRQAKAQAAVAAGRSAVFRGSDAIGQSSAAFRSGQRQRTVRRQQIQQRQATFSGSIKGKFYANLTRQELLNNQLAANTLAREDKKRSERLTRTRAAERALASGFGGSSEAFTFAARGGKKADLLKTPTTSIATGKRKAAARSAAKAKVQSKKRVSTLPKRPSTEIWAEKINERTNTANDRAAKNQANVLAGKIARQELVSQYFPKGTKTVGTGLNKFITLSESFFTGTLAFGGQLASAGEKAVFLVPALGANLKTGDKTQILNFYKNLVTGSQAAALRKVYTDPRTYRDAAIGAAISFVLAQPVKLNRPVVAVKKIPSAAKGFKKGTLFKDTSNNLGMVVRGGKVAKVPQSLQVQLLKGISRSGKKVSFAKDLPKTIKTADISRSAAIKSIVSPKVIKTTKTDLGKFFSSETNTVLNILTQANKNFGKKAQAKTPGKRRPSKASIRRAAQGLPKKGVPQTRVVGNEIVMKLPRANALEQSIRINFVDSKVSLITKGKNVKLTRSFTKTKFGDRTVKDSLVVGRSSPITIGGKGLSRPASQIRINKLPDEAVSIISKSGVLKVNTKTFLQKVNKQLSNLDKNARAVEVRSGTSGAVTTLSPAKLKKLSPAKRKILQKQLLKQEKVQAKGSQGRSRVRQQILERIEKKRIAFEKSRKDLPAVVKPVIKKTKPVKKTPTVVKKQLVRIEKRVVKYKSAISSLDDSLDKSLSRFSSVGDLSQSKFSQGLSRLFKRGQALSQNTSTAFASAYGLGLALGGAFISIQDKKLSENLAQRIDQDLAQIQDLNENLIRITRKIQKARKVPRRLTRKKARTLRTVKKTPVAPKRPIKPKTSKRPIRLRRPLKKKTPVAPGKGKDLNWDKPVPRGSVRVVKIRARVKGVNKTLPGVYTVNRARKFIETKVDRSTARSYDLVSVGIKKGKDIKFKGSGKFRAKKSVRSKVLPVVERAKFAIDTRGEKSGLSLAKLLKPKKRKATKRKTTKRRK